MDKDLKIKVNDEEFYLVEFPVGDWSHDGHNQCDYYQVLSRKPVREVGEAHFRAKEVLGFDIGSLCEEYEENSLDENLVAKLKGWGYKFDESSEDGESCSSEEIINLWVYLLNKVDPQLELRRLTPPSIISCQYDGKNRHLKVPGYGTFFS